LPPRAVRRISEYIENNIEQRITVEVLANLASLSVSYFVRAFKQSTGVTPHDYLMRRRVQLTIQLLADTGMSLSAIAHAAGFVDQSHFARRFRQHVGMSPRNWQPCCLGSIDLVTERSVGPQSSRPATFSMTPSTAALGRQQVVKSVDLGINRANIRITVGVVDAIGGRLTRSYRFVEWGSKDTTRHLVVGGVNKLPAYGRPARQRSADLFRQSALRGEGRNCWDIDRQGNEEDRKLDHAPFQILEFCDDLYGFLELISCTG
jgi:AraC-like DNA-binding protein